MIFRSMERMAPLNRLRVPARHNCTYVRPPSLLSLSLTLLSSRPLPLLPPPHILPPFTPPTLSLTPPPPPTPSPRFPIYPQVRVAVMIRRQSGRYSYFYDIPNMMLSYWEIMIILTSQRIMCIADFLCIILDCMLGGPVLMYVCMLCFVHNFLESSWWMEVSSILPL